MTTMAAQITTLTVVYSIVYSDANQRKHQSSASLAFVRGIHRWTVNSPHKLTVTRKMFPFDDVIMTYTMAISCFGIMTQMSVSTDYVHTIKYFWCGLLTQKCAMIISSIINCRHSQTRKCHFYFQHWLHRKLSFRQLSVQQVMTILSKWHFPFHYLFVFYIFDSDMEMTHDIIWRHPTTWLNTVEAWFGLYPWSRV